MALKFTLTNITSPAAALPSPVLGRINSTPYNNCKDGSEQAF